MAYTPFTWKDGSAGSTPISAARLNAIEQGIASVSNSLVGDTAYIAPSLQNSWANFNNGFAPAGYWKSTNGFVFLRGMLSIPSPVTSVIFLLPSNYRPAFIERFDAVASDIHAQVQVGSNGEVTMATSANVNAGNILSLSGIVFHADQ